jgi:hypothetical protein
VLLPGFCPSEHHVSAKKVKGLCSDLLKSIHKLSDGLPHLPGRRKKPEFSHKEMEIKEHAKAVFARSSTRTSNMSLNLTEARSSVEQGKIGLQSSSTWEFQSSLHAAFTESASLPSL